MNISIRNHDLSDLSIEKVSEDADTTTYKIKLNDPMWGNFKIPLRDKRSRWARLLNKTNLRRGILARAKTLRSKKGCPACMCKVSKTPTMTRARSLNKYIPSQFSSDRKLQKEVILSQKNETLSSHQVDAQFKELLQDFIIQVDKTEKNKIHVKLLKNSVSYKDDKFKPLLLKKDDNSDTPSHQVSYQSNLEIASFVDDFPIIKTSNFSDIELVISVYMPLMSPCNSARAIDVVNNTKNKGTSHNISMQSNFISTGFDNPFDPNSVFSSKQTNYKKHDNSGIGSTFDHSKDSGFLLSQQKSRKNNSRFGPSLTELQETQNQLFGQSNVQKVLPLPLTNIDNSAPISTGQISSNPPSKHAHWIPPHTQSDVFKKKGSITEYQQIMNKNSSDFHRIDEIASPRHPSDIFNQDPYTFRKSGSPEVQKRTISQTSVLVLNSIGGEDTLLVQSDSNASDNKPNGSNVSHSKKSESNYSENKKSDRSKSKKLKKKHKISDMSGYSKQRQKMTKKNKNSSIKFNSQTQLKQVLKTDRQWRRFMQTNWEDLSSWTKRIQKEGRQETMPLKRMKSGASSKIGKLAVLYKYVVCVWV